MRPLKKFPTGWCTAGNHSHCRGAINNPGGKEKVCFCSCKCHKGKEVAPPEQIKKAYVPGSKNTAQLEDFISQLVAYGKVEVDLPDTDSEITSIRNRMTNAGRKAKLKVRTKIQDGKIVGWVPAARAKPRKKRTVKKK